MRGVRGQARYRRVEMAVNDGLVVVTREGLLAGEHLVEHHAQAVNVATGIDLLAHRLLGRHVGGCAQHDAVVGRFGCRMQVFGDAEVGQCQRTVGAQHHVVGLEVAMHDAGMVCRFKSGGALLQDQFDRGMGQRRLEHACQAAAWKVLHGDIGVMIGETLAENGHDVRMPQALEQLMLVDEATEHVRRRMAIEANQLDRNLACFDLVACQIDRG